MLRKFGLLFVAGLLPVMFWPSPALAWHSSSAAIDDVRYMNEDGGVRFLVDFRIYDHVGYTGSVRIRISDGYDSVVALATFRPGFNPAYYSDFSIYVSGLRLILEGGFVTRELDVTVEILDAGGNVLARDGGAMTWALGAI